MALKQLRRKTLYQPSWLWTSVMTLVLCASGGVFYQFAYSTYPVVQDRKIGMGDHLPFIDVPREVINVMLLGQSALYGDFVMLWLVQYLGGGSMTHRHTAEDLEVILRKIAAKKVRHEPMYLASCHKLMMDLKKPWLCEDVLKLGIEAVPESWLIPAVLGYVHYEQEEFLRAAEVFRFAGNIPDAPDYIQSIGTTVMVKKDLGDMVTEKLSNPNEVLSEQSRDLLSALKKDFNDRIKNQQIPPQKMVKADDSDSQRTQHSSAAMLKHGSDSDEDQDDDDHEDESESREDNLD